MSITVGPSWAERLGGGEGEDMLARIGLLALAVMLTAGCSRVLDTQSVESEIKDKLEQQLSGVTVEIDCPEDIEAKKGESFDCIATSEDDNKAKIVVTQTDDEGSIDFRVEELLDEG
ncbi:MAG TPA: DUF4333 domain-containing protein [Actinomycetota bacterium]|nr:DUF4333 domain-containing protein [Actinomycetota bacterium]